MSMSFWVCKWSRPEEHGRVTTWQGSAGRAIIFFKTDDIVECPHCADLNAHYFEPNDKRIKFRTKSLSIFDWFFQRKHQRTRNIRFGQKDCRWLAGIDSLLSGHANMTYLSLRTHYCIHPDEQRRLIRTFHRYAQYAQ